MKKIKLLSTLLLLTSVLLISSCKKDDDPVLTKTQLLTQHTWKYSSGSTNNPLLGQFIIDLYAGTEYTFKADKSYSSLQLTFPVDGKWEFSADEKNLILDKGTSDELTFEITKLDATSLEVKFSQTVITIDLKFVKK